MKCDPEKIPEQSVSKKLTKWFAVYLTKGRGRHRTSQNRSHPGLFLKLLNQTRPSINRPENHLTAITAVSWHILYHGVGHWFCCFFFCCFLWKTFWCSITAILSLFGQTCYMSLLRLQPAATHPQHIALFHLWHHPQLSTIPSLPSQQMEKAICFMCCERVKLQTDSMQLVTHTCLPSQPYHTLHTPSTSLPSSTG